jgi:hypothetical protein
MVKPENAPMVLDGIALATANAQNETAFSEKIREENSIGCQ